MSPVGHSMVGLAFAAVAIPSLKGRKAKVLAPTLFVAVANLPDWPIPNWGHDRYQISYSVFVNVAFISFVFACWTALPKLRSAIPTPCMLLGAGAWLSHLVLDSFYNHGRGIAIYWPISKGRLNLAMPWFNTLDLSQSMIARHNLSVCAIEFTAFLPIMIVALTVASKIKDRSGNNSQATGFLL